MSNYSYETVHEIWNDKTGERIVVHQDRDGCGLIEIRSLDDNGGVLQTLTFTPEQSPLVIKAIVAIVSDIQDVQANARTEETK